MNLISNIYKNHFLRFIAVSSIIVLLITVLSIVAYSEKVNNNISNSLIRLHVIANSDSTEDQQLKLNVRNIVLKYMKNQLIVINDVQKSKIALKDNINNINNIVSKYLETSGKKYSVNTSLGCYPFPTKKYNNITLPAGNYNALKVVIGEGKGQNWWCVLFPPLCFVDSTTKETSEDFKKDLSEVLSKDEYNLVTSSEDGKYVPIKVKFKIVELFQTSKLKIEGMFSNLF